MPPMRPLHVAILSLVIAALSFTGGMRFRDFHLKPRAAQEAKERGSFQARTRFIIYEPNAPTDAGIVVTDTFKQPWLQTQSGVILSHEVLLLAANRLNLEKLWNTSAQDAAKRMESRIEVALETGTNIATVTAWGNDDAEAADLANGVREAYKLYQNEKDRELIRRHTEFVEGHLKQQLGEVDSARLAAMDIQKKYGIVDTTDIFDVATSGSVSIVGREEELLTSADKEHLRDYQTARHRYHAALLLLSKMRELTSRHRVDEEVIRKPIEVLEVATPPLP